MKDSDLIKRNALIYERYKCQLDMIDWKEIEQFRLEVEQAFDRINYFINPGINGGIYGRALVQYVDLDPYISLEQMTEDIKSNERILISTLNNDSVLLPGELNLKFRAVHDYFHYLLQQPFDFKGELNVYKATKYLHKSDIGKRLLYSEIVLQASYCTYFNGFSDKQKVIITF